VVHLWAGPTTKFVQQASQNTIAETLRAEFERLRGFQPSTSELRSWRNSLRALANAVELSNLRDHGIALELQVPLSSCRIDALLTGTDDGGQERAVIVELKQWDDASASTVPECVGVMYGGRIRDVLHPSAQAGQYRTYLADTHSAFHDGAIGLSACSFLHDFVHDPASELLSNRHADILGVYPLFAGDRVTELVEFLRDKLSAGGGLPVLDRVVRGGYRAHKRLLDHTAAMIRGEPSYVLLDEQRVVFNSIIAKVAEAHDLGTKAVFVIRGGPGTGKSVLALNLVAELSAHGYTTHHATGSAAFTTTVRKIVGSKAAQQFKYFNSYLNAEPDLLDVLVCDEAHRIRHHSWNRFTKVRAEDPDRPQVDELLSVARVGVFFIDDLQAVRKGEIGNSDAIDRLAGEMGAEVHDFQLEAQFRCGGSDGFVRWVENTLHIRRTANHLWSGDQAFEFDIVDSVDELDARVRSLNADGETARLVAGYCWPWSNPDAEGRLPDDVAIDGWAMPWNAKPDAGRLAPGIPKSHLWASEPGGIDQVGCVYTAQGFEFDHVGVIFGRDLVHRPGHGWIGRREFSHDSGAKKGTSDAEFLALIKNTYRVLLTRGLTSCTVYFEDELTKQFVLSRLDAFAYEAAAETSRDYETH
jgi:uncharacterized protein